MFCSRLYQLIYLSNVYLIHNFHKVAHFVPSPDPSEDNQSKPPKMTVKKWNQMLMKERRWISPSSLFPILCSTFSVHTFVVDSKQKEIELTTAFLFQMLMVNTTRTEPLHEPEFIFDQTQLMTIIVFVCSGMNIRKNGAIFVHWLPSNQLYCPNITAKTKRPWLLLSVVSIQLSGDKWPHAWLGLEPSQLGHTAHRLDARIPGNKPSPTAATFQLHSVQVILALVPPFAHIPQFRQCVMQRQEPEPHFLQPSRSHPLKYYAETNSKKFLSVV